MSEENQEFDKYGRKIRKGFKIDLLPAVVAIAFFGGITAVILHENQPGTSDSPKTEVIKKFGESDTEGHNDTSITRDASYQAFGYSLTDILNNTDWGNNQKVTFSSPTRCQRFPEDVTSAYDMCFYNAEIKDYLGVNRCRDVQGYYDFPHSTHGGNTSVFWRTDNAVCTGYR